MDYRWQEFDDAKPVLILPVRLENGLCASFQDRQITFFQSFGSKLAIAIVGCVSTDAFS
jgi:hypothetical protein